MYVLIYLVLITVQQDMESMSGNINKVIDYQQTQQQQSILDWISDGNYSLQQHEYFKIRHENTGNWFLQSDEYIQWMGNTCQTLFCPGIPGAGKTVIAAVVVNDLFSQFATNSDVGIAYVYCNYRRRQQQSPSVLLGNILRQLAQKQVPLHDDVKFLYESHASSPGSRPSLDEMLVTAIQVARRYSRTFLVIDALDECGVSDADSRSFVEAVFRIQAETGMNICATSRFISRISDLFHGSLYLEIRATPQDIDNYLDAQMPNLHLEVPDEPLESMIKETILRSFNGM